MNNRKSLVETARRRARGLRYVGVYRESTSSYIRRENGVYVDPTGTPLKDMKWEVEKEIDNHNDVGKWFSNGMYKIIAGVGKTFGDSQITIKVKDRRQPSGEREVFSSWFDSTEEASEFLKELAGIDYDFNVGDTEWSKIKKDAGDVRKKLEELPQDEKVSGWIETLKEIEEGSFNGELYRMKDIIADAESLFGTAAKKESRDSAKFECMECGRKFKSKNTVDPKCPKCGSYDVELA